MEKLVVFLGRSVSGIISDARKYYPKNELVIISRDGDKMEVPEGLGPIPVSMFRVDPNDEYVVVGNGGTTQQLVGILWMLTYYNTTFKVVDFQKEGGSFILWSHYSKGVAVVVPDDDLSGMERLESFHNSLESSPLKGMTTLQKGENPDWGCCCPGSFEGDYCPTCGAWHGQEGRSTLELVCDTPLATALSVAWGKYTV